MRAANKLTNDVPLPCSQLYNYPSVGSYGGAAAWMPSFAACLPPPRAGPCSAPRCERRAAARVQCPRSRLHILRPWLLSAVAGHTWQHATPKSHLAPRVCSVILRLDEAMQCTWTQHVPRICAPALQMSKDMTLRALSTTCAGCYGGPLAGTSFPFEPCVKTPGTSRFDVFLRNDT
jgi:hypothetical protein